MAAPAAPSPESTEIRKCAVCAGCFLRLVVGCATRCTPRGENTCALSWVFIVSSRISRLPFNISDESAGGTSFRSSTGEPSPRMSHDRPNEFHGECAHPQDHLWNRLEKGRHRALGENRNPARIS